MADPATTRRSATPNVVAGVRARISRRRLAFQLARLAVVAAVSPVAFMLFALLHGASVTVATLLTFWAVAWLLVPLLLIGSLLASRASSLPGSGATFGEAHITLGAAKPIPRRSVLGAMLLISVEGDVIELSLTNGSVVRIATETDEEGARLLSLVNTSREGRTVAHELGSSRPAIQTGAALAFGGLAAGSAAALLAMAQLAAHGFSDLAMLRIVGSIFIVATVYAAARRGPLRIVIGADGVVLEGTRRRFFAFSTIEAIVSTRNRVLMVTRGALFGRRIVLTRERGPRTVALVDELGAAMQRASAAAAATSHIALLDRGERTLAQWRDALRRLATADGDYRHAGIDRDRLVETASDAGAPQARRLAAAIAISHSSDKQAVDRVRLAIKGLADERSRIVMADALDGKLSDDALARALAEDERARADRAEEAG
jgi:hypothetical protein